MKKFFFSVAALAAALSFTACSDENFVGDLNDKASWNADGTGYLAFNVSMPLQQNVSRAANDNDQFHDGEEAEYAVNDMMIVIFGGTSDVEAEAKFAAAYKVDESNFEMVGDKNNITSHKTFVQQISRMGGTHAFALVVVNNNGYFDVDGTQLTVNGVKMDDSKTFKDFQEMVANNIGNDAEQFHNNGFLMLNAPLWSTAGGGADPKDGKMQVLSVIDRSKIKDNKVDAAAEPAANVYVERAMSKVTLTAVSDNKKIGNTQIPWDVTNWALDNTNKSSYLIRSVEDFDTWKSYKSDATEAEKCDGGVVKITEPINHHRFVGAASTAHTGDATNHYRTYFAKDPNYGSYTEADFNRVVVASTGANIDDVKWKATGKNAYCAENTFNVKNQIWGATTRVYIKATLNNGNTFYAANEGAENILTGEDLKKAAYTRLYDKFLQQFPYLVPGTADFSKYVEEASFSYEKCDIQDAAVKEDNVEVDREFTTDAKVDYENKTGNYIILKNAQGVADYLNSNWLNEKGYSIKVGLSSVNGADGWQNIAVSAADNNSLFATEEAAIAAGWTTASSSAATPKDKAAIEAFFTANAETTATALGLAVYKNGISYYQSRIKHFGDSSTPWLTWEKEGAKPSANDGAYPGDVADAEKNYLGRWGNLRNNWYELNVSSISNIGYVNPPSLQGTENNTDDELQQWIGVDINILSWAKRLQNVAL